MFGYIMACPDQLGEKAQRRYGSCYCGLCRSLGERHGIKSRLTLNYDMTFLVLLLSSLYEPEERAGENRCMMHPAKKRPWFRNRFTDYAADLNLMLAWWNCMDDWEDDKSISRYAYAKTIGGDVRKLEQQYPRQAAAIRENLRLLKRYEDGPEVSADRAAECFGTLMGEVFVWREEDHWAPTLRALGQGLGRFIYMMDACLDYQEDEKHGKPNPLRALGQGKRDEEVDFDILSMLMSDCARAFEHLPLEQDLSLLRNILYAGAWQKYYYIQEKRNKKEKKEPTE